MNNEINIMIELQHLWDIVMQKEAEIERHKKSISIWEKRLTDLRNDFTGKENLLKNTKLKSKQAELKLEEVSSKITKIEQRKDNIKSERELDAQNAELKNLHEEKDSLENQVLELMEQIENLESTVEKLKKELDETSIQTDTDIQTLKEKISGCESDSGSTRTEFTNTISELDPSLRTRFSKFINSKDGIAIAKLNGEICSHCNFQIPSSIAAATLKRESINTCTNCGRFIY